MVITRKIRWYLNVVQNDSRPQDNDPSFVAQPQADTPPVTVEIVPPIVPTGPDGGSNDAPALKHKKRGLLFIGALIVGVSIVLGGSSAAAFTFWYQNPDKVLGDAFVQAIRSKTVTYTGSFDYQSKEATGTGFVPSKVTITVDGKRTSLDGEVNVSLKMKMNEKDLSLSGSGMYDKDANLYFKINNVRTVLQSFFGGGTIPKAYDDLITKVDGQWIKISADDTKQFSPEYAKTQTCIGSTLKQFKNDQEATNQIIDLYSANKFLVVKDSLGTKDGSLGYLIEGDKVKMKGFVKGLNDTKLLKALQKCDANITLNEDDLFPAEATTSSPDKLTSRFEVWVSQFSHQVTKLTLVADDNNGKTNIVVEPLFNQAVTITPPKESISLKDLQASINLALGSLGATSLDDSSNLQPAANAQSVVKSVELYNAIHNQYPTLEQLKASTDEAKISDNLKLLLTTAPASSSDVSSLQYSLCKDGSGGYVAYYDGKSKKVLQNNFGSFSCH